jgi:transcriptional regulator with XRE-family HTH domain
MRYTIREKRKAKGLTQERMADLIGVSPSMYCQLEAGKRRMNEDHLARIAEELDTTQAALYRTPNRSRVIDDLMEAASQLPPEWQLLLLQQARIYRLTSEAQAHLEKRRP